MEIYCDKIGTDDYLVVFKAERKGSKSWLDGANGEEFKMRKVLDSILNRARFYHHNHRQFTIQEDRIKESHGDHHFFVYGCNEDRLGGLRDGFAVKEGIPESVQDLLKNLKMEFLKPGASEWLPGRLEKITRQYKGQ